MNESALQSRSAARSFPAHPSVLFHIRLFVREHAAESRVPREAIPDLVLAVSEACSNALRHTATPKIGVRWRAADDRVEVEVVDQGRFSSPLEPSQPEEGGHGIELMTALMDEVRIVKGTARRPGTLVTLVKYRTD
jgi:anti-sigma regulatory factor (Ser/Thr protein kinase)